jgi:hypothetical protein
MKYISLSSPQGNAYYLLSTANMVGKDMGMSTEERQRIVNEMKSKDYANLCEVFTREFGSVIQLVD